MLASSNMVPPLINKSYTEVVAICTDACRRWADRRSWGRSPVLDTDRLLPRLSSWLDTFNSCEGPFIQIQTKQKGSFVAAFSRSEFKPTTYKSPEQQLRTCLEESKIKIIKEQGGAREDWLKDVDTHRTGSGVIEELSFSWTPEPCPPACVPTLLCCRVSMNDMRDEMTIMSPQSWTLLSQTLVWGLLGQRGTGPVDLMGTGWWHNQLSEDEVSSRETVWAAARLSSPDQHPASWGSDSPLPVSGQMGLKCCPLSCPRCLKPTQSLRNCGWKQSCVFTRLRGQLCISVWGAMFLPPSPLRGESTIIELTYDL